MSRADRMNSRTGSPGSASARHIRVRLAGVDADALARAAALLAEVADTGPVSAPYANRRGDGYRLYLDLYLTDDTDDTEGR